MSSSQALERVVPPVITPLREEHRPAARRVWDDEFGFYDVNETDLDRACVDGSKYHFGVVAQDVTTDEIVGVATSFFTSPSGAADYVHEIPDVDWPDWTAVMHIGCVRSDWQGYGIGGRLFEQRLNWGRTNGANGFLGIAWLRDDRYGSASLFDAHGFERLETVENYYGRYGAPSSCPDCGERCSCDAALYWRDAR